jgi:hypothetical protein
MVSVEKGRVGRQWIPGGRQRWQIPGGARMGDDAECGGKFRGGGGRAWGTMRNAAVGEDDGGGGRGHDDGGGSWTKKVAECWRGSVAVLYIHPL